VVGAGFGASSCRDSRSEWPTATARTTPMNVDHNAGRVRCSLRWGASAFDATPDAYLGTTNLTSDTSSVGPRLVAAEMGGHLGFEKHQVVGWSGANLRLKGL